MNLRNEKTIREQRPIMPFMFSEHLTINGLEFREGEMVTNLSDSRTIIIPIAWFPRLRKATLEQLNSYEISPAGCALHWEELDEDISVVSLLNGLKGGCCH